jgi:hypothetical protein
LISSPEDRQQPEDDSRHPERHLDLGRVEQRAAHRHLGRDVTRAEEGDRR